MVVVGVVPMAVRPRRPQLLMRGRRGLRRVVRVVRGPGGREGVGAGYGRGQEEG